MTANSAFLGQLYATIAVNTTALDHASVKMLQFSRVAETALTRVQTKLVTTGAAMKTFGRSMTQFVTLPIALVGGASVKMYRDFEFSMNKVVSLVGVARKQVDEWSKAILALAPSVGKSPKELADAMYFITSAGIRGKESMEVLEESAKSSAGGLGEVKVIADLLTSAVNAYGIENLSAARANDILTATVKEGKAEADLLAQSMGLVLPIASAMGASFAQVGAATAAMTRTGTKAATAAIQLRQMFNSLLKPAKEAEAALVAMHTSSEELRRIIREDGLLAALDKLKEITEEYGINALGKVIPNIRSLTGFLDIMGKNVDANREIFEAIEDSFGDANKMFEETTHTIKYRLNAALSEIQVSMVTLGKTVSGVVIPIFEKVASVIGKAIAHFDQLSAAQKKVIVQVGLFVAAVGPVITILGFLVGNVGPGLIMVFRGMSKAIGATAVRMSALNMAMLANPIGLLIAGIATLIALYGLYIRRIKLVAKVQDELKEFGVEATEDEIKRFAKMSEIARKKEMWAMREAKQEQERQVYFGKTTDVLERNEALAKKVLSVPGMNIRQLEETAREIEAQGKVIEDEVLRLEQIEDIAIEVEVELKLKLQKEQEEWRKNVDNFFVNFQAQVQQQANRTKGTVLFPSLVSDTAQTFGKIQEINDSTLSAMSKSMEHHVTKDSLLFIDRSKSIVDASSDMLVQLKKEAEGLKTAGDVVAFSLDEAEKKIKKTAKSIAAANIEKELTHQLAGIETMGKLVWNEMEVWNAKTGALEQALNALATLGISPLNEDMQKYTTQLIEAKKRSELLEDSTINLAVAMSDLQHDLAVAGMLAATFPEFLPGTKEFSQFNVWLDEPQKKLELYKQTLETLIAKKVKIQIEVEEAVGLPFDEGFELGIGDANLDYLLQQWGLVGTQIEEVTKLVKQYQGQVDTVSYDQLIRETEMSIDLIEKMGESYGIGFKVAEKSAAAWTSKLDEAHKKLLLGKITAQDFQKFLMVAMTEIQGLTFQGLGEAVASELAIIQRQAELTGDSVKAAKDSIDVLKAAAAAAYGVPANLLSFEDLTTFIEKLGLDMQGFLDLIDSSTAWDKFLKNAQVALQSLGAFVGSLQGLFQQQMQNQITAVEEYAKKRNKSERWVADETLKIHKEMGKKIKAMAILQAIINGALAITNILATVPAGPLNPLAWVGIGMAIAATAAQVATIAAQPLAEGGIIPPGYPNDTYPALLTSGERVIPATRQRKPTITPEVVEFRIEGTELVGILKKQMSLEENF